MSDTEGSLSGQEERGVVAGGRDSLPLGKGDTSNAAYKIRRVQDGTGLEQEESEGEMSGDSAPARGRGGQPRLGLLFGLMLAGFASVVLSALLLAPRRQKKQPWRLADAWSHAVHKEEPWGLPSVAESAQNIPAYLEDGRNEIGGIMDKKKEHPFPEPGSLGQDVLVALGEAMSGGKRGSLVGSVIKLQNMQKLGSPDVEEGAREYQVTKYLFEDSWSVFVEVAERETGKTWMMRIHALPPKVEGQTLTPQMAEDLHVQSVTEATTAMLEAVGGTPLDRAAQERGLALSTYVATIDKVPPVVRCSRVFTVNGVELMERFHGSLEDVFTYGSYASMHAKLYAAQMMLQEVLLLQSAGVSHNNLKLQNFYVRNDGSIALGDFDASNRIGTHLTNVRGVTPRYAEKELSLAATEAPPDAEPPIVDRRSDMWSLGLCLYQVFVGGRLPYHLDEGVPAATMLPLLEQRGVRGSDLVEPLTRAGVPHRWVHLMAGLLEPRRGDRIDAETIVKDYSDLLIK